MLTTTGQRARVTTSIIEGQPAYEFEVDVISIEGDVLTYTTDGVWYSTARPSTFTSWALVGEKESPYAVELRERHDRIAAGLTAFRAVSPIPGQSPSKIGAADAIMQAARDHVWAMYVAECSKVEARA